MMTGVCQLSPYIKYIYIVAVVMFFTHSSKKNISFFS
jgi:hypothetical protein